MARKEYAVAVRAAELGTGVQIRHGSAGEIRRAVTEVLKHAVYRENAYKIGADFRKCGVAGKIADFVEKTVNLAKATIG